MGFDLDQARTHVYLCGNAAMVGRPRLQGGERLYPQPPGMVEILETRFGFDAGSAEEPGNIHFERY